MIVYGSTDLCGLGLPAIICNLGHFWYFQTILVFKCSFFFSPLNYDSSCSHNVINTHHRQISQQVIPNKYFTYKSLSLQASAFNFYFTFITTQITIITQNCCGGRTHNEKMPKIPKPSLVARFCR